MLDAQYSASRIKHVHNGVVEVLRAVSDRTYADAAGHAPIGEERWRQLQEFAVNQPAMLRLLHLRFACFLRIGEARAFHKDWLLLKQGGQQPVGLQVKAGSSEFLPQWDLRPKGARSEGQKGYAPCVDDLATKSLQILQEMQESASPNEAE
eukprot:gene581-6578_t